MTNVAHLCQCVMKSTHGRSQWPDPVPAISGTSNILFYQSDALTAPLSVSYFSFVLLSVFFLRLAQFKALCLRMVTI